MVNENFDVEKTIAEIIQSLETDERFATYFQQFNDVSVANFINAYAHKKAMWLELGESFMEIQSRRDTEWIDLAYEHLEIIQQHKLFEAQCLWRAEQLIINEVEICFDFVLWRDDILNCPFIEPISKDDIKLYLEFLNTGAEDDFNDWQNYEKIKDAYHHEEDSSINFPKWYRFCIERKRGSHLLSLLDIKKVHEEIYLDAWRKIGYAEKEKARADWELNGDKRPWIGNIYEPQFLDWFVKTYESPTDYSYYKAMQKGKIQKEEDYYTSLVCKLVRADEPIPVSTNADWKEALQDAYFSYEAKKIVEYLPVAFEQYTLKRNLNINPHDDLLATDDFRNQLYGWINIGKKILGVID